MEEKLQLMWEPCIIEIFQFYGITKGVLERPFVQAFMEEGA